MAKKARAVEGVYEKNPGSGVWYTRLRVQGKLVRKKIGTHKEAKDYIEKARTIRNTGVGIVPKSAREPARTLGELQVIGGTITVGELCDQYLKHIKNPNNPDRPKDQRNPPIRITAIQKAFGGRPAGSIRAHEVKDWLADVVGGKPGTMNRYKSTFSAVYAYARERSLLDANPVRDTKQFKVTLPNPRYLKPSEESRLYSVLNKWIAECPDNRRLTKLALMCHPLEVDVAIGTGLRKGNQYGMLWDRDVDFSERMIHIPESKNGESVTVPMVNRTYAALKAILEIQKEMIELLEQRKKTRPQRPRSKFRLDGHVFVLCDNQKWWEKALEEAKIEDFRWHDLRHTTGSRMVQAGGNLKAVQEVLHHKSIQTTARYAHMNKSSLLLAMDVLNEGAM